MYETTLVTPIRSGPEGMVFTPEDGEVLVNTFNADDEEGAYVMIFLADGNVMITDLNDWDPSDEDFLFI